MSIGIREITILALMAACNAALELTLGNFQHSIRFPFTGTVMVGLNLIPYAIGYWQVPRRGAISAMGLATAFLNLVCSGSFKLMALPAMVLEAALMDAIISTAGLKKSAMVAAGIAASIFSMAWSLTTARILVGRGVADSLLRYVGAHGWTSQSLLAIAIVVTILHAIGGAALAVVAWRVLGLVQSALDARHQSRRNRP